MVYTYLVSRRGKDYGWPAFCAICPTFTFFPCCRTQNSTRNSISYASPILFSFTALKARPKYTCQGQNDAINRISCIHD